MPYMPDRQTAERWGTAFEESLSSDDPAIVQTALDVMRQIEAGLRTDDDGQMVPVARFRPSVRMIEDERGTDCGTAIERSEASGRAKGIPQPSSPTFHASRPTRSRKGRSSFVVTNRGTAYVSGPDPIREPAPRRLVRSDDVTLSALADAWMRTNHPDVEFPALVGTSNGISWQQLIETDSTGSEEGANPAHAYALAQHRTDLGGGFIGLSFPVGSHVRSDHRIDGNRARTNPGAGWAMRDAIDPSSTFSAARPVKRRPTRVRWTAPAVRRTDPTFEEGQGKRGQHRRTRLAVIGDTRQRWTAGGTPCTATGALVTYADRVPVRSDVERFEVRNDRGQLIEVRPGRYVLRDEYGVPIEGGAVRTAPPVAGWVGTSRFARAITASTDHGTRRKAERARAAAADAAVCDAMTSDVGSVLVEAWTDSEEGSHVEVALPTGGTVKFTRATGKVVRFTWAMGDRSSTWTSRTIGAAAVRLNMLTDA